MSLNTHLHRLANAATSGYSQFRAFILFAALTLIVGGYFLILCPVVLSDLVAFDRAERHQIAGLLVSQTPVEDGDCHWADTFGCSVTEQPPCDAAHEGDTWDKCIAEREGFCYDSWWWEDCLIGGTWDEDCAEGNKMRCRQNISGVGYAWLTTGVGVDDCGTKEWCGD